ncbi:hypothetical protein Cgig2_003976 [Carnegiea gigantea]|uniref:C2H2-type domain-containing protein n=1 Tax=Carnegiea gigantea TaxID=171969 RepID=A0A9Q1KAI3_9CARY|nr:hypothetical protein Cgig2_003976 [Carnegiea gigantea]
MATTTSNNRGGAGEIETFAMANCLMLLSSQSGFDRAVASDPTRMFSCKTCGRRFPSFQALGGHRASHNKNKPLAGGELADGKSPAQAKPKTHACSICGLEFPIGQALGGHMRRHRAVLSGGGAAAVSSTVTSEGSVGRSDGGDDVSKKRKLNNDGVVVAPVLKKWNNSKRICLGLDLNFPPWKEEVVVNDGDDHDEIEEGEIVEQESEDNNIHAEEQKFAR